MTLADLSPFPSEVCLALTTAGGRPSIWLARVSRVRGEAIIRLVNIVRKNLAMALSPEEVQNITADHGGLRLESDTSDEIVGRWMTGRHFLDPRDAAPHAAEAQRRQSEPLIPVGKRRSPPAER